MSNEIEQRVIGEILTINDLVNLKKTIFDLDVEWFINPANKRIFQLIIDNSYQGRFCDEMMIVDSLGDSIFDLLIDIRQYSVTACNINISIDMLKEIAMKRELMKIVGSISAETQTVKKASSIITDKLGKIEKLKTSLQVLNIKTTREFAKESTNQRQSERVSTGLHYIDDNLTFYRGHITTMSARPGTGKTAWGLTLLDAFTKKGYSVAYICLESRAREMYDRLICMHSGLSYDTVRNPQEEIKTKFDFQSYEEATKYLVANENKIHLSGIDTFPIRDLRNIEAYIARLKQKHGLDIVFMDYLQKLTPMKEHRRYDEHERIKENMFKFSLLAQEYDFAGFMLSQLKRVQEDARKNQPKMQDLKGSSAIEDESVNIVFLHTPYENNKFSEDTRWFYSEKARYNKRFRSILEYNGQAMKIEGVKVPNYGDDYVN